MRRVLYLQSQAALKLNPQDSANQEFAPRLAFPDWA
jgi:hypothetical protein